MNEYGRVAVCGQISQYNEAGTNDVPAPSPAGSKAVVPAPHQIAHRAWLSRRELPGPAI